MKERAAAGRPISGPGDFARSLALVIEKYNSEQECDCSDNYVRNDGFGCVYPRDECSRCAANFTCDKCDATPIYEWLPPDEYGCLCSPGEGLPSSTASKFPTGCRCKSTAGGELTWLCVPYGLDAGEAVTATFSATYHPTPDCRVIDQNVLLQGELAGVHAARSDTAALADETSDHALTAADVTADAVLRILRIAYLEAPHNAVLRLQSEVSNVTTSEDVPSVMELAAAVREQVRIDGREADQQVGAAGIGGTARIVIITDSGDVQVRQTTDNFGLPVTLCPIDPDGQCPDDSA
ncbi:hypothetical protein [Rhodococcus jostii]|uniref:hypothetical protein n=1 Tax=Rhodococcus jostii TaxID=132919 RepID=UPI00365AC3E8